MGVGEAFGPPPLGVKRVYGRGLGHGFGTKVCDCSRVTVVTKKHVWCRT